MTPGYVLHTRPFRDTSLMIDAWTREQGRLTLFARGARGAKSRLAGCLQPFQLLLLSFSGRGDAAQLTGVEREVNNDSMMPAGALMPAYYLNELVLKLTLRQDPQPPLFDAYRTALRGLAETREPSVPLRQFELELLAILGFGIEFRCSQPIDAPLRPDEYYRFRPGEGFSRSQSEQDLPGEPLLQLATGDWSRPAALQVANKVLRAAIEHCLEGRELRTRGVARAVYERTRL
jgi:DNA repair protein RecO (recombination protein O)